MKTVKIGKGMLKEFVKKFGLSEVVCVQIIDRGDDILYEWINAIKNEEEVLRHISRITGTNPIVERVYMPEFDYPVYRLGEEDVYPQVLIF